MKKFKFNLQKILEFKQHLEKRQQQELAVLFGKLASAESVLTNIINEREHYWQRRIQMSQGARQRLELTWIDNYTALLKQNIVKQTKVIETIKKEITKKQEKMLKVVKERKSLEKYKEKKMNVYKKEFISNEQKMLDEVALRKYFYSNSMN